MKPIAPALLLSCAITSAALAQAKTPSLHLVDSAGKEIGLYFPFFLDPAYQVPTVVMSFGGTPVAFSVTSTGFFRTNESTTYYVGSTCAGTPYVPAELPLVRGSYLVNDTTGDGYLMTPGANMQERQFGSYKFSLQGICRTQNTPVTLRSGPRVLTPFNQLRLTPPFKAAFE